MTRGGLVGELPGLHRVVDDDRQDEVQDAWHAIS